VTWRAVYARPYRALLEQELVVGVEEEDAEGAVQHAARLLLDEAVRGILAVMPHDGIAPILLEPTGGWRFGVRG